jgi:hypothetical protein
LRGDDICAVFESHVGFIGAHILDFRSAIQVYRVGALSFSMLIPTDLISGACFKNIHKRRRTFCQSDASSPSGVHCQLQFDHVISQFTFVSIISHM